MHCKKGMHCSFNCVWYSIQLDLILSILLRIEGWGFYLPDKICQAWQKLFVTKAVVRKMFDLCQLPTPKNSLEFLE